MSERSSSTGLLVSGGLDSCILLAHLLRTGRQVHPLYIRSGLVWQRDELRALRAFMHALAAPGLAPLVTLEAPLADLYTGHWSVTGVGVPDETTPDEAVFLPGRNVLLVFKAAIWRQLHGGGDLALATLKGNPFPDASTEFFADLESALNRSGLASIRLVRPFSTLGKREVMELGRSLPLELTFSCIAPVQGLHCGHCNKCAERQAAFRDASLADATPYADRPPQPGRRAAAAPPAAHSRSE